MQKLVFNHAFADKVTYFKRAISMRSGIEGGLTPKSDSQGFGTVFSVSPCVRTIIIHKIMNCFDWRLNTSCAAIGCQIF